MACAVQTVEPQLTHSPHRTSAIACLQQPLQQKNSSSSSLPPPTTTAEPTPNTMSATKPPHPCQAFPLPKSSIQPGITCQLRYILFDSVPDGYPYELPPVSAFASGTNGPSGVARIPKVRIPFYEFRGIGPPPTDIGNPGDVYVDCMPKACGLYGRLHKEWERWKGPILHDNESLVQSLISHPDLANTDRYLWCNTLNVTWCSKLTIRKSRKAMQEEGVFDVQEGEASLSADDHMMRVGSRIIAEMLSEDRSSKLKKHDPRKRSLGDGMGNNRSRKKVRLSTQLDEDVKIRDALPASASTANPEPTPQTTPFSPSLPAPSILRQVHERVQTLESEVRSLTEENSRLRREADRRKPTAIEVEDSGDGFTTDTQAVLDFMKEGMRNDIIRSLSRAIKIAANDATKAREAAKEAGREAAKEIAREREAAKERERERGKERMVEAQSADVIPAHAPTTPVVSKPITADNIDSELQRRLEIAEERVGTLQEELVHEREAHIQAENAWSTIRGRLAEVETELADASKKLEEEQISRQSIEKELTMKSALLEIAFADCAKHESARASAERIAREAERKRYETEEREEQRKKLLSQLHALS